MRTSFYLHHGIAVGRYSHVARPGLSKKLYANFVFPNWKSPSVSFSFSIGSVVVIPIYIYWTRDSFQHSMLQARIRTKHSRMRLEPSEPQNSGGGEAFLHTYAHKYYGTKKKVVSPVLFSFKRDGERGDRGRAVDIFGTHITHTHTFTRIRVYAHAARAGGGEEKK